MITTRIGTHKVRIIHGIGRLGETYYTYVDDKLSGIGVSMIAAMGYAIMQASWLDVSTPKGTDK